MTLHGARLELSADVDGDGVAEDATFWLGEGMEISPKIETQDLIGQAGSQALSIVDWVTGGEGGHAGVNFNFGGGISSFDISFKMPSGAPGLSWGDGSDDPQADATGSEFMHQMSVWHRYLDVGEYDSQNPAVFSFGEYSASGVYDPLYVAPQEPAVTFDAENQSSMFDGSLTLVSIRALEDVASMSAKQDTR